MSEHIIHHLGPFLIRGVGSRLVRVYVPPRLGSGPIPALYLFDGQNLFHDEPSFAGGWRLHTTTSRLVKQGHPMPVIIGVDHGGGERLAELSPWPAARSRTEALLDWLTGDLMPRIQSEFHVASDPPHVGVGGSSLGGLAALYAHFRNPERFGRVLAMSPSLWVGRGALFGFVAGKTKPWTTRIYLDAGALEAGGRMLASAKQLAESLKARGWNDHELRFVASKRGAHSEKHWRRRAPGALRFLFGK